MVESITVTITTTTSNSRRQMHGIRLRRIKEYHDSHAHDGEAPRFEFIKAADVRDVYERGGRNHNHGEITIDGYAFYEIKEYHNRENPDTYTHYRVPTCCISPIIVLDREFIDAGTLKRHELSQRLRRYAGDGL